MANFTETSTWETGIYQLETTDPVQGGAGGASNCQPQQLTNRTKKIYDTLITRGVFIDPADEIFVGQPVVIDATFEGTVSDGDVVYWNISNTRFEKAIADGSAAQNAVGLADVTNDKVLVSGLVDTSRSDTPGDILYLSSVTPGAITTISTGVAVARYQYGGIIFMSPAASATAAAASIAPGSITPAMLQEAYYTETEIDAKCGNWDTAYTERHQWDGGATNLVAATGRTSLGLTGDVSTHCHDAMYYTETEIDAKCGNWDTAYTQTRQWDGGASGLTPATGRSSLGLTGDVTTHCHGSYYFTKAEINACCGNWDSAYTERRQWDGGATNLNASTGRTSLGLTGDVSTHCHDAMYAKLSAANVWTNNNTFDLKATFYDDTGSDYSLFANATTQTAACFRSSSGSYAACFYNGSCGGIAIHGGAVASWGLNIDSYNGAYILADTGVGLEVTASHTSNPVNAINAVTCGQNATGVYAYACNTGSDGALFYGYVNGVCGHGLTGAAVKGNTAYCNASSQFLKQLRGICVSECLRNNPIGVYKYYWEDSNHRGFNETIGPVAEEFNSTFVLDHSGDGDGYEGVWSVDGVAFGLGVENLAEIDKLKRIVVELHSCVKKLENK